MTPEEWKKVSEIYHAASELSPESLPEFLEVACDGDPTLRREVESLLAAGNSAESFISEPIVGNFASGLLNSDSPFKTEMFAHYKIVSKIGSGGMGEVFHAVDTKLGRNVAIKTLSTIYDGDPNFLKRFRNEARAAATLNHPNVATVYSVEDHDDLSFITMELVNGKTLDKVTPENGLEINKFLEWFEPLAHALSQAHKRGIIHRDIKPGNIMISDGGIPKILDFGLAQFEAPNNSGSMSKTAITAPGQILGTPSYMSPEQAEGNSVDKRSDIFSFGSVMYEALTGKRPFRGPNQSAIVEAVIYEQPEPISKLKSDVPPLLERMVTSCLEKSPGKRFQSMRDVHSILKDAKSANTAGVSMDSFARRFYREARSSSKMWLIAAAAAVLLVALGGWYFISRPATAAPFSVDRVSIRKLSQSNNVALSVISPDGRSIAYVTYEQDDSRSLWLRRVTETNAIKIVPSQQVHYWDISFSNDGEYVYFITAPRFGTHGTLFRVPALGGQPRKVAEKTNHLGNLSPDGKRVLFVRYGDPAPDTSVNVTDSKLISTNAENGGDEQVLRILEGESIIRKARFSPDGRSILYIKREFDGVEFWSIARLDAQTGSEEQIVRMKERIDMIEPLQKGNGLLMNAVDSPSNRRQLFYVSIPDGEVSRITNDLNSYIGVSVDRDGRNIVAVQRTDESRVWVGSATDPKSMMPITREPLAYQTVDWMPDGRIVFDVLENDRLSVWIADSDGKNALQLTPQDSDNSNPQVSGDGRSIVFTSRRSGRNQIWRMETDGSNQTLLANTNGITQAPLFAADGKTVVFRWYNEGSPPMGQVSIEGGPVTGLDYLPYAFTYYWAMSPDGKYVAYTIGGGTVDPLKVLVRPSDSLMPKSILSIRPTWFFKWTPDSKSLIYQESQQGEGLATKVFQVNPDEREPKLLVTTEPDHVLDLTYSRDGSRFAAVRQKVSTDAVMLSTAQSSPANSR